MDDPDFRREAQEQDVYLAPLQGAEMEKIVEQVFDTPDALKKKAFEMSASALQ